MGCLLSKQISVVPEIVKNDERKAIITRSFRQEIPRFITNETSLDPIISDSESNDSLDKSRHELSLEVLQEIIGILKTIYLFQSVTDSSLRVIAQKATFSHFDKGRMIVAQQSIANPNDPLYLVWHGSVEIRISGAKTEHIDLKKGDIFGEISALFGSKRSADVFATSDTVCLLIPKSVLKSLPVARSLRFLRKVPILQGLSDNQIVSAYPKLSEQSFKNDEKIVQYGDVGDTVFIIRSGWVRIVVPHSNDTGELEVARLRRGQVVGQLTLLTKDRTRTANGIAAGDVRTIVFDNKMLIALNNPALNDLLDYDLVTSVLRAENLLGITQKNKEYMFECVDRDIKYESDIIVRKDQKLFQIFIVRNGNISQSEGKNMIKTANGIVYFGSLSGEKSIGDIIAKSKTTLLLYAPRMQASDQYMKHGDTGIKFNNLKIQSVLGKGNSGNVYLVKDSKTQISYALKCMNKSKIKHMKQIQHAKNELEVIRTIKHPFCTRYVQSFQDHSTLYILQEWVCGGELFNQMQNDQTFKESAAKFYAAIVVCAIEHLHNYNIIYRDLKPENLLLDEHGYIVLADFGFAKNIASTGRTFTICGTPEYQAPEVVYKQGTSQEADFWSLGVLIYEMLVGYTPFGTANDQPYQIYQQSKSGRFVIPNKLGLTPAAHDIIKKLIVVNPNERLGSKSLGGVVGIKSHPWFRNIDWDALLEKKLKAPMTPARFTSGSAVSELEKRSEVSQKKEHEVNVFPDEKWVEWSWI